MYPRIGAALAPLLVLLAGCDLPAPSTLQSSELRGVWIAFTLPAIAVYAIVGGLIVWSSVAYRRRDPAIVQAARFHENPPLEIAWTVIPILIVGGLFAITYPAEHHVENLVVSPDEVVQVVGFRWSWRFLYPRRHVAIDAKEGEPPELVLPAGRTTEIRLTSSDVVHAFWVPAFLFKRDAVPGRVNAFDLSPTKTGSYPGRCAEYCGTFHAHMSFNVRVVAPDAFERWLAERKSSS